MNLNRLATIIIISLSLCCAISFREARADPREDFAFEVKESTGEFNAAWVISKLTTFKVGAKCWSKIIDKSNDAVHSAGFYTRDIVAYAKDVTGNDWAAIEVQNGYDRENNKKLFGPMMDAFKSRFNVTVYVEGDDCNASANSLWLTYWTTLGTAIRDYPPKSGKAFVTLNVTAKARDISVSVDPAGTTFVITAPRDFQVIEASDKISKPFRKVAKSPK